MRQTRQVFKKLGQASKITILILAVILPGSVIQVQARTERIFSKEALEYRLKGYKASQNRDYDEAIKYLQKSIHLDPYYAAPHNDLGIIYEIKGWVEKAEQEYLKALSIDPDYADSIMNLALLYQRHGSIDKAIPYFQKRVMLGPPDNPWVRRAKALLSRYAPELYNEITQKEEARNLMYRALEEKQGQASVSFPSTGLQKSGVTLALPTKEPESVIDGRLENYLRLEKDLFNPELKKWILGMSPRMMAILYGDPAKKKLFTSDGREVEDIGFNRWISNLDFSLPIAKEIYHLEGRRMFKEKWIYKIPYKYKKHALKSQIVLIFENGRLSSWEK
jgi:tetratricopeptide (TPR) repeat protein